MDISESSSVSSLRDLEDVSCPICLRHFTNLQDLNDHLDTDHGFTDNTVSSNTSQGKISAHETSTTPKYLSPHSKIRSSHSRSSSHDENITRKTSKPKKLEIDKSHWEKYVKGKKCHYCQRRLNPSTGLSNCNKCGKLFCRRHCTNIIKLNLDGNFDPQGKHSRWYNCCHDCFISRPGYNEFGETTDLTEQFKRLRNEKAEDSQLIKLQLETRLIKLLDSLLVLYKKYKVDGNVWGNMRFNIERSVIERQITPWKPDQDISNCNICSRSFSYLVRKHHCRLCGNIVCGALETRCSHDVPFLTLRRNATDLPFTEMIDNELLDNMVISLRLCANCLKSVYIPRKFHEDIKLDNESSIMIKYRSLQNVSRVITYLLPQFQDMIQWEETDRVADKIPNVKNLQELSKLRERLLKSFNTYNILTRQLMLLPPKNESERKIQQSIQISSSRFINEKVLPLRRLSGLLSASPQSSSITSGRSSPLETPNDGNITIEKTTLTKMMGGLTIKQVKQYREELMVIKEQSFLIDSMIAENKKQRKFDEIKTLTENLNELHRRAQELETLLGDQGFQ